MSNPGLIGWARAFATHHRARAEVAEGGVRELQARPLT